MPVSPTPADGLQFDKAEVPARRSCSVCKKGITGSYYKIDAKIACEPCQQRVQELMTGGNSTERFVKAAVFGTLAAALGAGIYYAILAATGYEIGLISILVGIIVGQAVKKGSNSRGGWVYQGMAMFLTYTAIVSAYVPIVIGEWSKHRNNNAAVVTPAAKPVNTAPPTEQPESTSSAEPKPAAAEKKPLSVLGLIVALILLIIFAYALPILAGFQNIIGLFIIGIGMYQAWKLNKRVKLDIKGPFSITPTPPMEAAPAGG